jgi:beta-glucosidase
VIGNASKSVPGAAGETTSMLKGFDIPPMIMADGPAGLRLSQKYYVDEKGPHAIGETMPESVLEYLPGPVAWMFSRQPKIKEGVEIKEQYATAIPIGTAIAQSWNLDFAQMCGDIVGSEMERFGVHLWLAPALNIHRSIRCGRNFEYFSEDPLISGLFAAALTNGVQAHPGCGTTIKHYAANNQETNRYDNNSQVSERAMREIYLKGFEICVKKSQPCAVMTSYNLLNGVHTSESRDLTEDILRKEFGFEGIVMTDWVIAVMNAKKGKYPAPDAGKVAAAGSHLFMPGSMKDYKEALNGLKTGVLTRRQLEISASRMYRMIRRLVK